MEGRGVMTTAPISLQDLRRRLYVKAKAEKDWRFWGLYVHVGKLETLRAGFATGKQKDGAPGIDGGAVGALPAGGGGLFFGPLPGAPPHPPLPEPRGRVPQG